jgi:two-component sensor histidine kinase
VLPRVIPPNLPPWVRFFLLRPVPFWQMQLIAAASVAIATVCRVLITPLVADSVPFLSFLPAILVAALMAGQWGGLSALIYSSLVVDYFWLPPHWSFALASASVGLLALFWLFSGSLIAIAALVRALVRTLVDSEQRARILAAEMSHRVRNVLGLVQAISRQTFRTAPSPSEYQTMFEARITALGRAQDLIADDPENPPDLKGLLKTILEPFGGPRFIMSGAPTGVPREISATLALLIHELGTNAVKYGALSVPTGEVTVRWERDQNGVRLDWKETKGPPVAAPARTGFGSRLLKTAFPPDFGVASIAFEPDGVQCHIRFPAAPGDKSIRTRSVRSSAVVRSA